MVEKLFITGFQGKESPVYLQITESRIGKYACDVLSLVKNTNYENFNRQ